MEPVNRFADTFFAVFQKVGDRAVERTGNFDRNVSD